MITRRAACSCGQLAVTVSGDPVRISVCHCLACQRRTGSMFGAQARFPRDGIALEGRATQYVRIGDSGNAVTFNFCPICGTTLFWEISSAPDLIAVAIGGFADPEFPEPKVSVYEARRHPWVELATQGTLEHLD